MTAAQYAPLGRMLLSVKTLTMTGDEWEREGDTGCNRELC